jgi:peptidyl-prolyl cis-trans isomerase C
VFIIEYRIHSDQKGKAMMRYVQMMALMVAFSAAVVLGMGKSEGPTKKTQEAVKPAAAPAQPAAPAPAAAPKPAEAPKPAAPAPAPETKPVAPAAPKSISPALAPAPVDPAAKPAVAINLEEVILKINGVEIKRASLEQFVEQRTKQQLQMLGPMGANLPPDAMENMKQRIRPQIYEMLIDKELAEQKIKAKPIQITDEQLDVRMEEIAKSRGKTIKDLEGEMAAAGAKMEEVRKEIRLSMGLDKLLESEMSDADKTVTDDEAKKFYDENVKQFSQPEQVQASHILLGTKDMDAAAKTAAKTKAEEVLKLVKAGGDFAALAKEHSTCPSKERGGDLGYFGKEQMVPEFANAAWAMKVGDISEIVESQFGYHIIKVTGRKEAVTEPFDKVKEQIVNNLKTQKRQQFWTGFRVKMREGAKIDKVVEFKMPEMPTAPGAGAPGAPKVVPVQPKPAAEAKPAGQPKTVTIEPKSAEGEKK